MASPVPPSEEPPRRAPRPRAGRDQRRTLLAQLQVWRRDRRRWQVTPGRRGDGQPRRHFVVAGDDPLAHRLVDELTSRYPVDVTVVVRSRRRGHGAKIAAIAGVRVIEADQLDAATLRTAGVPAADAFAIVHQDDVGNIHTALLAQELNPSIRLVVRMFNTRLGSGVREMFHDCAVLSDASMAAPGFVAAAFGEIAPTHVRLPGRTLFISRREDVRPQQIVCGLADTADPTRVTLLPDDESRANLVLAAADGGRTRAGVPQRLRRRGWWRRQVSRVRRTPYVAVAMVRVVAARRLWRAALTLLIFLISGSAVLSSVGDVKPKFWDAVYVTLINAFSGSVERFGSATAPTGNWVHNTVQLLVVIAGVALIPVVTAAVIEMMVTTPWASLAALGYNRHVIVIGLGNVGTRVLQQLHDLGVNVVAVDKRADARGAQLARQLEIPFIVGDGGREETLRAANVRSARAVVALSTDDVINLEAALNARTVNPGIRPVLRLFDGDFAELVQKSYGIMISRSVSYVAAPAFAAAMLEREVIGTIPVERRVLLLAQVPVIAGSTLDGEPITAARVSEQVRVIGFTPRPDAGVPRPRINWTPPPNRRLVPGDTLLVIATRAGLGQVLTGTTPPS